MNKKGKRILAIIGVILLLSLVVVAFISAFTTSENGNTFFMASVFCLVMIPILLYLFMVIFHLFDRKKKSDDINEKK